MKKIIFILFLLPCFLFGQDTSGEPSRTIDSLKLALKNAKHDTTRCNILNELIEAENDELVWPIYNEQLQKLAEKCASTAPTTTLKAFYLRHVAGALNNIGFLANQQGDIPKALEFHHKSLKIQNEIRDKKGISITLSNIGLIYKNQGDIAKALKFYYKSLKIQEEIHSQKGIAYSLNSIGFIYDNQGNIPKALECYHKSLKILEELQDKKGLAYSLNNIGFIYSNQGDITKALEFFHKSLKIREEIIDKKGIANSLVNIGAIYLNQGDIPKALEFYHKSLKIREDIMDKQGIANTLNNIGSIYKDQGDPSCKSSKEDCFRAGQAKALEFFDKSLKILREIMDKKGIAYSLNNIGGTYQNQGDIPTALEFFHKSLEIQEEIMNKAGITNALNHIGGILLKQGKTAEAIVYAKRSMGIAKELGFPSDIKDAASLLKLIYEKQNKYKEAFDMYELEIQMSDSINNQETRKASIKKQMQYTYETQAKELKNEQDKKDIIAKAELTQREKERNYFVIGFALVIVLALFIFRSYRQKQKANIIISQQKHEVEESKKEILDSIHYAKRIQKAHLPTEKQIEKSLNRLQNKG